jgi:hypothetical protein
MLINPLLRWVATYSNDTILTQDSNSSEMIDRSILKSFALYDIGGNKIVEQIFKPGQRFQYRCRTIMATGHDITERVHIIVCQSSQHRHVIFVFESDMHIEISDFVEPEDATDDNQRLKYPLEAVESDLVPIRKV